MKLSTFRRISQAVTFTGFILLFAFTVYPYAPKFPLDAYLRLDPLVALVAMVGSRAIIVTMLWAGLVLAFTFAMGRFFCGYVCPLGTLIDFSDFLIFGKKHKKESLEPKPGRRVKYFVLIAVIAASLLGANFLGFVSPMAIAPRAFALVIFPPFIWLVNGAVDLLRPALAGMGFDSLAHINFHRVFFSNGIATLALVVFIIAANYWRRRFWCRFLCPTGALLSVVSRFGIFKRNVNHDACSECKLCGAKCDMRAVDTNPRKTVLSECTLCGDCIDGCGRGGISIGMRGFGFSNENAALNVGRRAVLQSALSGLVLASVVKGAIAGHKNIEGRFIRPPGSLPEGEFLARCIRCGDCLKICPTNGLQPAAFEAGFDGLWTPHLVARHGPCEDKCNMCGHVCPTRAIRALPLEEKQFVKIGTAVVDRSRCIAWEQEKLCLICDEICPVNAIETRVVDNFKGPFKRPFVEADKCIGCGYCEKACPVFGRAAIEVYSIGEERIGRGSYVTDAKKRFRSVKDGQENRYSADELGSGGSTGQAGARAPGPEKGRGAGPQELPKGFITE